MKVVENSPARLKTEIELAWRQQNEFAKKTVECIVRIGELLIEADALTRGQGVHGIAEHAQFIAV